MFPHIVLIVRWLGDGRYHPSQKSQRTALNILDGHFAKNKIEKDEFEEKTLDFKVLNLHIYLN
tara:strand:- start:613 stop:801 length:189 start_codon:yes stop_codon:yes gene_type:complete